MKLGLKMKTGIKKVIGCDIRRKLTEIVTRKTRTEHCNKKNQGH